jgi:hypothetical protein
MKSPLQRRFLNSGYHFGHVHSFDMFETKTEAS